MKDLKRFTLLILCIISLSSIYAQQTISDITLPAKQTIEGQTLTLNGGGLREKLWIDLYVGGLYLTTKTSKAKSIIDADEAMSIHLEIVSGLITSEKMIDAVNEGFEKSTNGNTSKFNNQIKTFTNAFNDPIVKGNNFDISYIPGTGVLVSKNGKTIATIKGLEFKKILFGIWLGEKPADKNLKEGMLGL